MELQKVAPPGKERKWPICFDAVIPPGETVWLRHTLTHFFKGQQFIVTMDDVHRTGFRKWLFERWCTILRFLSIMRIPQKPGCFIADLLVGNKRQLPVTNPISSTSFTPGVLDNDLPFDTGQPGLDIAVAVTNRAKTPQRFAATIFGRAIL